MFTIMRNSHLYHPCHFLNHNILCILKSSGDFSKFDGPENSSDDDDRDPDEPKKIKVIRNRAIEIDVYIYIYAYAYKILFGYGFMYGLV